MSRQKNKAVAPRLRFPEFRDTGPWEVKRLGNNNIATFIRDRVPSEEIPIGHYVSTVNLLPDFGGLAVDPETPPQNNAIAYREGDILISNIRPYLKKIWIADRSGGASNDVLVARSGREVKGAYLGNLLMSDHFITHIMGGAKGVKMPRGDLEQIQNFQVPVPPNLNEQQKIADCLSSLDELIRAETSRLEALQAHKKGLLQQLFPREGETTPRLRFPEFRDAGPWEVRTIEGIAEKLAQGGTPKTSVAEYWNGEIPWITPAEMGDDAAHHYTERTLRTISAEGLQNSSAELLPVNSVIVSSRAPIGYVTINKVEMATNQGCKGIVPRADVYHEFLYFSLLVANQRLNDLGAGAGFKEISASTLKVFPILVPELTEQQKIADCLSSLDELIRAQGKRIEALKQHKKGLAQQLFPQEVA